jgi:hypothetical protein
MRTISKVIQAAALVALFASAAFGQATTRTVTDTIRKPDGSAWAGATVKFTLDKSTYTSTASFPSATVTATTNSSGQICVSPCSSPGVALWANAEGAVKTLYTATYPDGSTFQFRLGVGDGSPVAVPVLRAGGITPAAPADPLYVSMQALVTAHASGTGVHSIAGVTGLQAALDAKAAASDLLAETAARTSADSSEAGARSAADTTLQGNITAEASTRAAADTTLQANIDAEAAARAAAIGAASTADRARSNHTGTQTLATISDAGTAASKNAPAAGNAAAGEVVLGSDTRLTDARTPTAHASAHAAAGSDPVTISESQVTNLVSDLAGKASTSHTHAAGDVTSGVFSGSLIPNLDASKITTGTLDSARGGTGSPFFGLSGPTALRTFVFPDANATIARTDAAQTFSGTQSFSGQILVADGSATTPPVGFTGDTDTGATFHRISAGKLGVTIDNGARFMFADSTNFGFQLGSGYPLCWSSGSLANNASDLCLYKAKAGVTSFQSSSSAGGTYRAIALTPSQITADQNNYNPGGTSLNQRWSSDASRSVTGLSISQVDGEHHYIWNVGAQNIVLVNESASSTAANRFTTTTGADLTLSANKCALVMYDGTSGRWRATLLP